MCLTTKIYTRFYGIFIGQDALGNKYYINNNTRWFGKEKRWVIYQDEGRVANLDPLWFKWLHYLVDEPPIKASKKAWMLDLGTTDYDRRATYQDKKEKGYKVWIATKKWKEKKVK
jgi:NADH:ubiquinone oxidoreductase subunit